MGRPFYTKRMVQAVDARLALGQLHDITELNLLRIDDVSESTL